MTDATTRSSWSDLARRPRSSRVIAFRLALWREVYRFGGGAGMLVPAGGAFVIGGGECRDEALLVGLDERIAKLPEERRQRGTALFMNQMGSHGPAYYKRSGPADKRFVPECTDVELARCDDDQLINAYDNSIVASDRMLAATIRWLQQHAADHATALVDMSDHGESLAELGIFLHGLPYRFAPEAQTRVPTSTGSEALAARHRPRLRRQRPDVPQSRADVHHAVLGLLDVTTPTYDRALDTFAASRTNAP
jgi:lipid A ethanolaminephosphotransferase